MVNGPMEVAWMYDWMNELDPPSHTATEAEAHLEWHRNSGVPLGQPCPWDACDPEPPEETYWEHEMREPEVNDQ